MIYFVIVALILIAGCYVMAEIMHCRKGHDVYDWTKKLVEWMDKNDRYH